MIGGGIVGAIKGLFSTVTAIFRHKEHERIESGGMAKQELKNRDKTDAAEARMDKVKPRTKKEVQDDLAGGKF